MVMFVASLVSDRSRTLEEEPLVDPDRARLMDEIRTLNPSADRQFLSRFRREALALYLEHLDQTQREPRGPHAIWTRPADTPAIVARSCRD